MSTIEATYEATVEQQHAAGDHLNCDVSICPAAAWKRGRSRL